MDIEQFPGFKSLNATQIANFTSACETRTFKAGSKIINLGERGNCVYLILEGEAQVYLPDDNAEQEIALVKAPAFLGELEFLTDEPRSASVRAVSKVECLTMSYQNLQARIKDGDAATLKVIYNIARVLAHRLSAMDGKLREIELGNSRPRSEELHEFKMKLFGEWSF